MVDGFLSSLIKLVSVQSEEDLKQIQQNGMQPEQRGELLLLPDLLQHAALSSHHVQHRRQCLHRR